MAKTTRTSGQRSALRATNTLVRSSNPAAPKADITNAPHLFGDAESHDPGSFIYGDAESSTAVNDMMVTLSGDAEYGDVADVWRRIPKGVKYGAGAAALAAGTYFGARAIKRAAQKKSAARQALQASARLNTIENQVQARRNFGKIARNTTMPFYMIQGAVLNQYPLAPTERFVADTLKFGLDYQASLTPFEAEIVPATFSGTTFTASATGTVSDRFYYAAHCFIGINALAGNPGTIFSMNWTLPTVNGTLSTASSPFVFTMQQELYAKFSILPWALVTNKPVLAVGKYSNTNPITVAITGLPSTATVTLIVPGSLHPATIALRNSLL